MQLSRSFRLAEFERSDTATRLGIDNSIPPALLPNVQRLVRDVLQPLRDAEGLIRITSGYRSPVVNEAAKGSKASQHTLALAADFTVEGQSPLETCERIVEMGLPFDQLIHEYGSWVHCSVAFPGVQPRRQLLTIDRHGTRAGLHEVRA